MINLNNVNSYDTLEEILNWKHIKKKPRLKPKDRIEVEIELRKLFDKLNKS